MIRVFQIVGLSLLGALLLAAASVPAASAQFESESEEFKVTTSSNELEQFTVSTEGLAFACTGTKFDPTLIITKHFIDVVWHKTWLNCHSALGQETSVVTNGCQWVDHLGTGKTAGTTDIECEGTKGIELKIGSICTYKIDTQTGLSSTTFSNLGSGTTREVRAEPKITGITVTRTTNDLFCPAGSSTGTYRGAATLTAENLSGQHVGFWVD